MLMSSPLATVILCLTYLLIVRILGPLFMANREPYDLKYPMLAYNLFQTIFNGWIFLGAASFWFGGKYNWVCQAVDYSTDPQAISALSLAWWFYFSKFIDFFDSFFFLLRKKFDHLSTLHVVHHSTLPFFSWFGAKYAGGGNTSFGGMLNTLVHVHILLPVGLWTQGSKTSLVEEIPDLHADGPVRAGLLSLLNPPHLFKLWLLQICEHHPHVQWNSLLVPLPQLLQEILPGKESKKAGPERQQKRRLNRDLRDGHSYRYKRNTSHKIYLGANMSVFGVFNNNKYNTTSKSQC